jgi:hypothetical protein
MLRDLSRFVARMLLLLFGVVATVTLWTRGYWYVWGKWMWPVLDAHYKANCYKEIDPLRDAELFAGTFGAVSGAVVAIAVALVANLRWHLIWLGLGSLSIALLIVAATQQPASFLFLLTNSVLATFIVAIGVGAWIGQRARLGFGIGGV